MLVFFNVLINSGRIQDGAEGTHTGHPLPALRSVSQGIPTQEDWSRRRHLHHLNRRPAAPPCRSRHALGTTLWRCSTPLVTPWSSGWGPPQQLPPATPEGPVAALSSPQQNRRRFQRNDYIEAHRELSDALAAVQRCGAGLFPRFPFSLPPSARPGVVFGGRRPGIRQELGAPPAGRSATCASLRPAARRRTNEQRAGRR